MSEFDIRQMTPPHIAAVSGYHPIPPVTFAPGVLKMDLNESMIPPSPRVTEALHAALRGETVLNWYPEPTCTALRTAIGRHLSVPAGNVLVTNGSNQAMELVARALLMKNDPVLIVSPVYSVFKIECQIQQAQITEFFFQDPFEPSFDELLARANGFKAIFLANPNNPTGVGYTREQIVALLERCPNTFLILDEAYAEFHDAPCADLVVRFPNLLVLRSFSKAWSLAGLRCGYIVAQSPLLEMITHVFPPWSVNTLTQVAAEAAVTDTAYMQQMVAECHAAKRLLVDGLRRLGFNARNTQANFILWQVSDPAGVVARLAQRQVFVSNKDSVPQMKGFVRVAIGTREHARRFLKLVEEFEVPAGAK